MHSASGRHDWVNALRAIGIGFVVLGHTLGIGEGLEKYIFSFHMPLFFFISGLVLSDSRLAMPMQLSVRHYARRLLLPYVLFSVITYIPWVLVTRHWGADAALNIDPVRPLLGTFYGIGVDGWLQHNAMLWFFPCLFVLHLLFRLVHPFLGEHWLFPAAVTMAIAGTTLHGLLPVRLPWGMEIALIAMPFYAAGYLLGPHVSGLMRLNWRTTSVFLACGFLQYISIQMNGRVDMNFLSLGNVFLFYLGAFAGIGALLIVAVHLPASRLIQRVAEAGVVAFPLHRVLFSVFSAMALLILDDVASFKSSPWGSTVYALGAIGVSAALLPLIRRNFPALIGGR